MLLVDVPDEAVVDRVADELLEAARERLHERWRDTQLLVLLLADVAGAVVHGDADAPLVRLVCAAAVPETPDPDEDAALGHLGRDRLVELERVGGLVAQVAPGTSRVAPFSSVKSVMAHMVLQMIGTCGRASGMSWSSAWIGCACSSGPMEMDEREEMSRPGSRTPSTTGSTLGCKGIFWKVGPCTRRL